MKLGCPLLFGAKKYMFNLAVVGSRSLQLLCTYSFNELIFSLVKVSFEKYCAVHPYDKEHSSDSSQDDDYDADDYDSDYDDSQSPSGKYFHLVALSTLYFFLVITVYNLIDNLIILLLFFYSNHTLFFCDYAKVKCSCKKFDLQQSL